MSMLTQKLPLRVTITESPNHPLAPPSTPPPHTHCSGTLLAHAKPRSTPLQTRTQVSASNKQHVLCCHRSPTPRISQYSRDLSDRPIPARSFPSRTRK